jgi:dipeptidase E
LLIFIQKESKYKLLKGLKESRAFDKIQEYIQNNGIVVGCSAGAVVCGKDIDIIASMDPNDVKLTDTKGFDVLSGISVFPHYINLKSKLTDEENQARVDKFTNSIIEFTLKNGDVYAIPEEDTIYINGTEINESKISITEEDDNIKVSVDISDIESSNITVKVE